MMPVRTACRWVGDRLLLVLKGDPGVCSVADRSDAEPHDVGRTQELEDAVGGGARGNQRAEPQRHESHLHHQAEGVPDDGEQGAAPTDAERAADREQQARPRHLDEENRGDEEGDPLT